MCPFPPRTPYTVRVDRYPGIPEFLTQLLERLDAHAKLADQTAEVTALRKELQARCSRRAWESFVRFEEALQQRERVLFEAIVEYFLLPDDQAPLSKGESPRAS